MKEKRRESAVIPYLSQPDSDAFSSNGVADIELVPAMHPQVRLLANIQYRQRIAPGMRSDPWVDSTSPSGKWLREKQGFLSTLLWDV